MEDYLGRLEGPIAVQVWNRFVSLAKDIAANVYTFKMQVFPTLRLACRNNRGYVMVESHSSLAVSRPSRKS